MIVAVFFELENASKKESVAVDHDDLSRDCFFIKSPDDSQLISKKVELMFNKVRELGISLVLIWTLMYFAAVLVFFINDLGGGPGAHAMRLWAGRLCLRCR